MGSRPHSYRAAVIAATLVLVSCQAKITERIEGRFDGSAIVHLIVDMDDQFYNLASQQKDAGFEKDFPSSQGWQVVKTANGGQHKIDASRTIPAGETNRWFQTGNTTDRRIGFLSGASPSLEIHRGLFTDTYTFTAHVPPIVPPGTSTSTNGQDAQAEKAAMGMMSSMFSFNLQLALPGKLKSTNGEIQPDGSVNWVVGMQRPTDVSLVLTELDYLHIWIAVAILLAGILALASWIVRR